MHLTSTIFIRFIDVNNSIINKAFDTKNESCENAIKVGSGVGRFFFEKNRRILNWPSPRSEPIAYAWARL